MCWDCYDHPKGDPYKIFTQGGVPIEDFDEEPVKHQKKTRRKKGKRLCAKSKTEFCDYSVRVITNWYYSKYSERYTVYTASACSRCGRRKGWGGYQTLTPPS
jgi:hypothetical protein